LSGQEEKAKTRSLWLGRKEKKKEGNRMRRELKRENAAEIKGEPAPDEDPSKRQPLQPGLKLKKNKK